MSRISQTIANNINSNTSMIKAVIFDLDNTLLDFMKMKKIAVNAAIEGMIEAGFEINREKAIDSIFKIYDIKGYEYQEVFDDFIKEEKGEIDYKLLASAIVNYKKAKEHSLILYPNVHSTLISLSKMGLKLGVVSDAPSREAWVRIYTLKLHNIFDSVITLHELGIFKPDPKPFTKIIHELNIIPEQAIMVGDWPERDIQGAKKVGMQTAFAKYGDTFNTIKSGADYDLEDISDLLDIIIKRN